MLTNSNLSTIRTKTKDTEIYVSCIQNPIFLDFKYLIIRIYLFQWSILVFNEKNVYMKLKIEYEIN